MAEPLGHQSPLVAFYPLESGADAPVAMPVVIEERPFLGHINMRGDPSDRAFRDAVTDIIEFAIPMDANTVTAHEQRVACWLGPNEWLLICGEDEKAVLAAKLRDGLGTLFAAVTDVSSGQTIIRIGGQNALDVLAKGCTLDLHPRVFGSGRCAQSSIAKSGALIRHVDETPTLDIVVRRSFADYLWQWLTDAAAEYCRGDH